MPPHPSDVDTVTTPSDLSTYIINLPRRPDRRAWIQDRLPSSWPVTYTSDLDITIDGRHLAHSNLRDLGITLFDWQIDSDNLWWNRPLKYGEIGCTIAHLACWNHAAQHTDTPYTLILEDDAVLTPALAEDLPRTLTTLTEQAVPYDLLYLGRAPIEPDTPSPIRGLVRPGYSHCTYAYLLTRQGLHIALSAGLPKALIPIDEFLPALYTPHPRPDVRATFPPSLTALAFDPPLVTQRPKDEAGSDTEDSDFLPTDLSRRPLGSPVLDQ